MYIQIWINIQKVERRQYKKKIIQDNMLLYHAFISPSLIN